MNFPFDSYPSMRSPEDEERYQEIKKTIESLSIEGMAKEDIHGVLTRKGMSGVISHNEVVGSTTLRRICSAFLRGNHLVCPKDPRSSCCRYIVRLNIHL